MGLQRRLAVDDVHSGLLQGLGPVNIHALVKARGQLDECDGLLATLGGSDQVRHQRRVVARAIHRLLDRQHVGVGDGLFYEALHRGRKRVIRVMHEHVAFSHRGEHVGALALMAHQAGMGDGRIGRVAQLGHPWQLHDLPQSAHIQESVYRIDLVFAHAQQSDQLLAQTLRAARADLYSHDLPEAPTAQLVLDRLQQVGGVVETSRSASLVTLKKS